MAGVVDRLGVGKPLLGDGALGTMLFARGIKPGQCPELLNVEQPALLVDIARQYAAAGADWVTTNTFGGSPLKLAGYGLADRCEEINRAGVALVREAVGKDGWVAGDVGPTGAILKPYGDADPAEVAEGYRRQCGVLADAGVDLYLVETMIDLREAELAVRAAREAAPQLPVLATMTFDPTPRGFYTVMGVTVEQAAHGLAEAGADAVGSNCGNGIETMVEVARAFVAATDKPVIIQSNAGLPELIEGQLAYAEDPTFTVQYARALVELGVAVIGGCCGTTPEHIAALRALIDHTD
jgi:5-methyltetrahydrofolate--homocysteine methyltransferase